MAAGRTRARARFLRRSTSALILAALWVAAAALLSSCAALESWDRYARLGATPDGGDAPEDGIDPGGDIGAPDGGERAPIEAVQIAFTAVDNDVSTLDVAFDAPQREGDLIVLVVGWYDTTTELEPPTDTSKNVYTMVGDKLTLGGQDPISQVTFFAKNIKAAAAKGNTIRITWGGVVVSPDVRAVEYSGLSRESPLIGEMSNTGSGLSASTSALDVAVAPALLFVGLTTEGEAQQPGTNFTKRILTNQTNFIQDRFVDAPGNYPTDVPLLPPPDKWVVQLVGFH